MSTIKIDNGYLIITADEDKGDADVISAISDSDDGFDISFDTEEVADDVMDQLAEALCGKWLDGDLEGLAS